MQRFLNYLKRSTWKTTSIVTSPPLLHPPLLNNRLIYPSYAWVFYHYHQHIALILLLVINGTIRQLKSSFFARIFSWLFETVDGINAGKANKGKTCFYASLFAHLRVSFLQGSLSAMIIAIHTLYICWHALAFILACQAFTVGQY